MEVPKPVHRKVVHHFKHWFVPHEHNEYRPHFFRELSIATLLILLFIIMAVTASSAYVLQNTETGVGIVSRVLIDLTNQNRSQNSLSSLTYNSTLESAAQLKALDMASNSYFAHISPAGITPWYWMQKAGYGFTYAGENLAVNFTNSSDVSNAWMASPLHKANILSPNFKEIGISMHDTVYENKNTIFVVQMFGTRAIAEDATKKESILNTQKVINKVSIVSKTPTVTTSIKIATNTKTNISTTSPTTTTQVQPEQITAKVSEVKGESTTSAPSGPYATNVDQTIFNSTQYASILLTIIFVFVFVGVLILIFFEIEKQHPKHILYGFFTLSLILVCAYIVKNVFIMHFVLL